MQTVLYRLLRNLVSGTNSNRKIHFFAATPENYSIFILLNNSIHAKCLGHSTNSSSSNARKKQKETHSSCPVVSSCSNCSVNGSNSSGSSRSNGGGSSKRFLWIRGAANRILSHHVALAPTDATAALIINLYKLPMCVRAPFAFFGFRLPPMPPPARTFFPTCRMLATSVVCVCASVGGCEECIK